MNKLSTPTGMFARLLATLFLAWLLLTPRFVTAQDVADPAAHPASRTESTATKIPEEPSPKEIARLIEDLGAAEFTKREAAQRKLIEIGIPAIKPLWAAMENAEEGEVRRRCRQAIQATEERAEFDLQALGAVAHRNERGFIRGISFHDAEYRGREEANALRSLENSRNRLKKFGAEDFEELERYAAEEARYLRKLERVRRFRREPKDEDFAFLLAFAKLETVGLDGKRPELTDAALAHIGKIHTLKGLSIEGASITDDGLRHLAGLTELKDLSIENTPITGEGLKYLQCEALDELNVSGSRIYDRALRYVRRFPELRRLNLSATPISDGGLRYIGDLRNLKFITLNETTIGGSGLQYLNSMEMKGFCACGTAITDASLAYMPDVPTGNVVLDRSSALTGNALKFLKQKRIGGLSLSETSVSCKALDGVEPPMHVKGIIFGGDPISVAEFRSLQRKYRQKFPDLYWSCPHKH